jgi:intraflagellar transport protein 140
MKFVQKSQSANKNSQTSVIKNKMALLDRFLQARKLQETNGAEMVRQLTELLDTPNVDQAIRVGDVFATLIEFH